MNCRDCPRFDSEKRICQDGKLNPGRYEQAQEIVRLHGLRSICVFNDFRERLVYNRSAPLTKPAALARKPRRPQDFG